MDGQEAQVDFTIFLAFVFQNPKSLGDIRGFMGRKKKKREREKGLRKSWYVTTFPGSIVWGKYRCKRETCEHWSNEDVHPTGWQHFWEMEGFQGRPSNVRDLAWDDQAQQLNIPKHAAAAAAELLQSCPTLCDPMDGSPPGSPVPGILQARVLEWGAIAISVQAC